MQKISKKSWIEIAVCSGVFVALAVIAGLYDLAINKALYNPDNLYGQFFARLGELPSYITAPTVGVILFYQGFGKTKRQALLIKGLAALLVFAGWFYAVGVWFWENFITEEVDYSIIYKLFFCAVLTLCSILACAKVDKKLMRKLLVFALFAAIVVALSNIIVQIMKMLWSRQRFRTMVDSEANAGLISKFVNSGDLYQGFSHWYKPSFLFKNPLRTEEYMSAYKAVDSDAFKSFPSGHTVAASASFALIILPEMFSKFRPHKWMFWTLPAVYTALVGLSRIIMGAHYLSDIVFGGFIGFAVAALIRWVFVNKLNKIYFRFDISDNIKSDAKIIVLSD